MKERKRIDARRGDGRPEFFREPDNKYGEHDLVIRDIGGAKSLCYYSKNKSVYSLNTYAPIRFQYLYYEELL